MLAERLLSKSVSLLGNKYFRLKSLDGVDLPAPGSDGRYLLYVHIPFCQSLCPYCSFNRFPYEDSRAKAYFASLRTELRMLHDRGYRFDEMYLGGGTPTIDIHELAATIRLARELWPTIREVSTETNPNHLDPDFLRPIEGLVQRMSVGVQSFDDDLLRQMGRYEKYGSSAEILKRIQATVESRIFDSLNVDMIFNLPGQTAELVGRDISLAKESGSEQVTFYPLMVSPVSRQSIETAMGRVDPSLEEALYHQVFDAFCGGAHPDFTPSSCYTFARATSRMIDEYVVNHEEYIAAGSGGISYLDGRLFVNTFSLADYERRIASGALSVMGETTFPRRDQMRYRFMMELFGLRLDKAAWRERFGCSVAAGLPAEYAFMKANGAFDRDDEQAITLTPKGRYLMVAMMRQFFIGVNSLRDQARASLPGDEHALVFGDGNRTQTNEER